MLACPDRRNIHASATIALAAIIAAPLLAGCFGPSTTQSLVGGSGYTITPWITDTTGLIDADLSPDRENLASLHTDSTLRIWTATGSPLASWTIPACPYQGGCNVRFLEGGRVLTILGNHLRVWSPSGALLSSPSLPGGEERVVGIAVARGGLEVILGLYAYVNHSEVYSSVVLDINANVTSPLALGDGVVGYVGAASGDGSIVATSGSSVQFWRRPSELMGEVSGIHEVVMDEGGSFAALRSIYNTQTTEPFGVKGVDLLHVPPQVRILSQNNSYEGTYQVLERKLSMSAGGRFVAFPEQINLAHCGGMDCVLSSEQITRIVDVDHVEVDRGFGGGAAFKVFLADDGSAIAIMCGVGGFCQHATLTFADANSTPPHVTTTTA